MRLWSSLSARTKRRYKSQGVTPSGYNAWQRKPIAERRKILKEFPAKSGPAAAVKKREAAAQKKNVAAPRYTPVTVARHAATILPGGVKVTPIVERNTSLMEDDELRAASLSDYHQWAAMAANQDVNNPWFYHSVTPRARRA